MFYSQDRGAQLGLESRSRASEAALAGMQSRLQAAVTAACEDEDIDLSRIATSSADPSSASAANHMKGVPLALGKGVGTSRASGGRGQASSALSLPSSSCGFLVLDRLLDKKKDAVAAVAIARRTTLKDTVWAGGGWGRGGMSLMSISLQCTTLDPDTDTFDFIIQFIRFISK